MSFLSFWRRTEVAAVVGPLDPTNAIVGNHDLIRVAVARHPGQAVPLLGLVYGNKNEFLKMSVDVFVRPVSN